MDGVAAADLTMAEPRAGRIHLPGRDASVATLEFGPPERPLDVIFSHANGFNARTYRTILQPLANRLRILAYDLRGHGATESPTVTEERRSWDDLRDDLIALLDDVSAQDVVLAGHSMGATTSLLAAAASPERVRALVLFEPVLMTPEVRAQAVAGVRSDSALAADTRRRRDVFPSRQAAIDAYTGRGAFARWSPAMLADYVEAGLRPRADGMFELACSKDWEISNYVAQGHDTWGAFARVSAPIRIFRAEHGSTTNLEPLTGLAGASHFLPMERPELVAEALLAAAG
jgi:pimeloyl-ACP methyl ester carboxylesterase